MHKDILLKRFMARVVKSDDPNGCWLWTGSRSGHQGYGGIRIGNKTVKAHRASHELFKGPIPPGLYICHTCDNPPCVNPDHLFAGSHLDNMRDKMAKGRHSTGFHDPMLHAEITRRTWAGYDEQQRAMRIGKVSDALKDKPFSDEHLANLRASPANQKGRPARGAPPRKLTDQQLAMISIRYSQGETADILAREFNVTLSAITKWMRAKGIERQAGYGTGESSGLHGNTGKVRTEEQKRRHSEFMKQLHREKQ